MNSNTNQLKKLKEEFYEIFYKPRGVEGWHIEGTMFDIWSFIQKVYSQAKEEGRKEYEDI